MKNELTSLESLWFIVSQHGRELIFALIVLIVGLYIAKWLTRLLRIGLGKITRNHQLISNVCYTFYTLLMFFVIAWAAEEVGFEVRIVFRILMLVSLIAIGAMVLFRPYLPSLPFKVNNTVKIGDILGKVEVTTFLNTRIKTFDGKTVFIPNRQVFNDVVINYQYTETRRIKVDVRIRYDQDILHAKRVMESVMIADSRVEHTPRPVVYTLALEDSWVKLGARCWVDNQKYWILRCDLTEKIKYGFDGEGIRFAFPQMDMHHYPSTSTETDVIINDKP